MSHKQYNEKFVTTYNNTEKINNLKTHSDITAAEKIILVKEFGAMDKSKSEDGTGPDSCIKQDYVKKKKTEKAGLTENSQMSVLQFCTFICKIGGSENTNYTAMETILAMDISSEESIIQTAQDYCKNTG